jgi:hypothetical protein
MSRDETLEHQVLGLSGRELCLALFAKYVALTIYAVGAALVEIPTFVLIASSSFAIAWAATLAFFAALAAYGVARTWATGRFRLEKWATAGFILSFCAYSFALIFRSASTGDLDSLPLAIVPFAFCILPIIRWLSLVVHARDLRFTLRGKV